MPILNGTIKRLVRDKGFGFIVSADHYEYFFHNSDCGQISFDTLREGQTVTFEPGHGLKHRRGENVNIA